MEDPIAFGPGTTLVPSSQAQSVSQQELRPATIVIRDHRIAATNFNLCSEMSLVRDLFVPKKNDTSDRSPVFALARDIIQGSDLAVTSIQLKASNDPSSENPALSLPRFNKQETTFALGSPSVSEVHIHLSAARQGQKVGFSMFESADLLLDDACAPDWIEEMFHHAVALKTLNISIYCYWNETILADKVVAKLRTFRLSDSRLPAEALYSFLSASAQSLAELELRQVTLAAGSTWSEVLSTLATRLVAMTSFSLRVLRDETCGHMPIDWHNLIEGNLEERYRAGLDLVVKGSEGNKRVPEISYRGPHAATVLGIVARCGRQGVINLQPFRSDGA